MMQPRARLGVTLVELLISMFMFVIVLGLFVELVRAYRSISALSGERDRLSQAAQSAFERLRSDVEGATNLTIESGGSGLSVQYPTLELTSRYVESGPYPPSWNPLNAGDLSLVEYKMDPEGLVRKLTRPFATPQTSLVAPRLRGFVCESATARTVKITLSFEDSKGNLMRAVSTIGTRSLP